jgi:hypothetical protein
MSNNTSNSSSSGIGFTGALTIAFVVLKLIGVINWSWWWVISPIWIGLLVVIVIFAITIPIYLLGDKKGWW